MSPKLHVLEWVTQKYNHTILGYYVFDVPSICLVSIADARQCSLMLPTD